jgi:hypothetical protein
MATLLHHHDTLLSRPNRYAGMSQNLLTHKLLESLDQLQNTLTQSRENARHFGRKLDTLREMVHELKEDDDAHTEQFKLAALTLISYASEIQCTKLPPPLWSSVHEDANQECLPTATPVPEKQCPMLPEPLGALHLIGVLNAGSFVPATKLAPIDEPSLTVVPEPTPLQPIGVLHDAVANSITAWRVALSTPRRTLTTSPLPLLSTPRSPTATFQIRRSLEFWIPTAIFKHRWRWKTAAADEFAAAAPSTGDINGRHGTTGVIFPGGSYYSVSMNVGNTVVSISHPWSPMRFAIPAGTSFIQRRAGGQGLRPWRQIRLASFPRASGRFQNTRLELMPFLEVHVVRHFWEPLEGSDQPSGTWDLGGLELHVAGAGANEVLDSFALWEAVLSRCTSVTREWAFQLVGLMFWVLCGPLEYKTAEGVGLCNCMG